MKLREVLDLCAMDELKSLARDCLLPIVNNKYGLIIILIQAYSPNQPYHIIERMKITTLMKLCKALELPAASSKGRLVGRIEEIIDIPTWNKETRTQCLLCGRMRDHRLINEHHFVPKAMAERLYKYIGGVVQICANCHSAYHRNEDEFKAKNRGEILTYEDVVMLFSKTRREIMAGKYGHM